jgi:4-amino-4-deoxy-L-arabinose transferase-like glycosyltransferase
MLFSFLLILVVILWLDLQAMPWFGLFTNIRILLQFRHLLHILILGSFALIILAGFGLDGLWRNLAEWKNSVGVRLLPASALTKDEKRRSVHNTLRYYGASIGLWLVGLFILVSVIDLYQTDSRILTPVDTNQDMVKVSQWLRAYDSSVYYVRGNPVNDFHDALLSTGHRFMDAWYHFSDIHLPVDDPNQKQILAQPNYVIQLDAEPLPSADATLMAQPVEGWSVFTLPASLPFVFTVKDNVLYQGRSAGLLKRQDVTTLAPFIPGPNSVEVIASGEGSETLVVLYTYYPGWQVSVDGKPQQIINLDGYLGVKTLTGAHKYEFSFRPLPFYVGLLISLASLTLAIFWVAREVQVDWRRLWQKRLRIRSFPGWMKEKFRQSRPGWMQTEFTYQGGVLHPTQPLGLPEGATVQVVIAPRTAPGSSPRLAIRRWLWSSWEILRAFNPRNITPSGWFVLALLVYLLVRLIGLTRFPIYFFTDEAIQTLLASGFLRDHLRDAVGDFLPTYFKNVYQYNLSVSVYLQVLPTLLFGKSDFITRLVPMVATLVAAGSVGLTLRDAFKLDYWWTAPLLLSVTPAWFLHSRTAFEATLMVSFYAGGLYLYLLYRYKSPRFLYGSFTLFALAFYSHSPGQFIVAITGILLLFSDLKYHWQNRRFVIRGLGLLILLALPYLRFRIAHPEAVSEHLSNLASYWMRPIPLSEKIGSYFKEYFYGLSPAYWFIPNERDLPRHLMKGYGQLYQVTLPFVFLGLLVALKNLRSSAHRAILIALLAAPTGAALVQITITRVLVMVIPAVLLASLGVITVLKWLEKLRFSRTTISVCLFGLLTIANFAMLRDSLVNGPTWYTNYGLGGMQYGGRQLFQEVESFLEEHPGTSIQVTPTWANGADVLANFFLGDPLSVRLGSIQDFINNYREIDPNLVIVMTQEEYLQAVESGKFAEIQILHTLSYPNGEPGFLFTRVSYIDNVENLFNAERETRRLLQEGEILVDGQTVQVRYSLLDIGPIQSAFDGDKRSLTRTFEANPYVIELDFSQPRKISGFSVVFGSTEIHVLVRATLADTGEQLEFQARLLGSLANPEGMVDFGRTINVQTLRLEFTDLRQVEPANVHIWEITLKSP